jgi:CRISPR-associated protein Cas1
MKIYDLFVRFPNFYMAWDRVLQNQGCAGIDDQTIASFAHQAQQNLNRLRDRVSRGVYQPLPWRQFWIPKSGGDWRELRVPAVRDRIVQQALLNVLVPIMEREFAPVSFAYRPGRSHLMAVQQVAQWRDRGYEWLLDADIVKYFDQLQHGRLLAEVAERCDRAWLLQLIEAWITAGVVTPQGLVIPQRGIPQGAVISPLLANIYLDDFDELVIGTGLKLVRYADDFVVLARTQAEILEARDLIAHWLDSMGLTLHPEKTRITNFDRGFRFLGHAFTGDLIVPIKRPRSLSPSRSKPSHLYLPSPGGEGLGMRACVVHAEDSGIKPTAMELALVEALKAEEKPIPPPLFVVLGYAIREQTSIPIISKEQVWEVEMATLYLVEQGTIIRKEQGRFRVKPPQDEAVEIPISEVEGILLFGGIELTTAVMEECLAAQIPVVFLTQLGEYKGHLWADEARSFPIHWAQYERRMDSGFALEVARAIVWGKLMNSKQFLLRRNRKRSVAAVREAIEGITRDIVAVEEAISLDQLRGYEGVAAARYFGVFGQLIKHKDLTFDGRNRRPPKDPVNSLLSFGYTLLYENVLSLLLLEGVSPYMGNFHYGEKPKAYLAFDLVEEFRSPIVDSLVMKLVNTPLIRPTDFQWPTQEGGIYLNKKGKRVFLKQFELAMSTKTSHPDLKGQVSYRRAIHLQVQRYKRAVRDNLPYEAFLRTM